MAMSGLLQAGHCTCTVEKDKGERLSVQGAGCCPWLRADAESGLALTLARPLKQGRQSAGTMGLKR